MNVYNISAIDGMQYGSMISTWGCSMAVWLLHEVAVWQYYYYMRLQYGSIITTWGCSMAVWLLHEVAVWEYYYYMRLQYGSMITTWGCSTIAPMFHIHCHLNRFFIISTMWRSLGRFNPINVVSEVGELRTAVYCHVVCSSAARLEYCQGALDQRFPRVLFFFI